MNQITLNEKAALEAEFETLRPMWLAAEDAVKQTITTLRLAQRTERMMRQRMDDIIAKLDAMDR